MNIEENKRGALLWVKVIPKSKCSAIVGWEGNYLKVRLAAVPEKGKANQELINFLAKTLNVVKSTICIVRGDHSRQKQLCFSNMSTDALSQILKASS